MASTTGIDSWAVDLTGLGAIYPFQGAEMILTIVGFACWIGWHVIQLAGEKRAQANKVRQHGSAEEIARAIDKYGD